MHYGGYLGQICWESTLGALNPFGDQTSQEKALWRLTSNLLALDQINFRIGRLMAGRFLVTIKWHLVPVETG